jgi:hypothetical protein
VTRLRKPFAVLAVLAIVAILLAPSAALGLALPEPLIPTGDVVVAVSIAPTPRIGVTETVLAVLVASGVLPRASLPSGR